MKKIKYIKHCKRCNKKLGNNNKIDYCQECLKLGVSKLGIYKCIEPNCDNGVTGEGRRCKICDAKGSNNHNYKEDKTIKFKCDICNKEVERALWQYKRTKEYHICNDKDCRTKLSKLLTIVNLNPGNPESVRKMVETRKRKDNYKWTEESKQKLSKTTTGRKLNDTWKQNMSLASKGKKKSELHKKAMSERPLHKKYITKQCNQLKQQGFRVIPLDGVYRIRPDIIAIKENKVYAVEVEGGKPNYKKYANIPFYDDIIWVLFDRKRGGLRNEQ